jgi:hypothetical protein
MMRARTEETMDETDERPQWANRPRIGDKVADRRTPHMVGEVVATFYGNGEGGMHVLFDHGGSWVSCHMVDFVERRSASATQPAG